MLGAIDSWLFILLVAIAALFRLLTKAGGAASPKDDEGQSTAPQSDQRSQSRKVPDSDEEQIRKFLEALGRPRSASVPPPVPPRTNVPPRPVAPVQPPRTIVPFPQRQRQQQPQTKGQRPPVSQPVFRTEPKQRRQPVAAAAPLKVPTFEVHETTSAPLDPEQIRAPVSPDVSRAEQPMDLRRLLRTPGGLRQAIILREIFGTPRSLQSIEDLPGTA